MRGRLRREATLRGYTCCLGALLITPGVSLAGGFYVPQKDAVGIGLASAGDSARSNDASTVYFNPAGMTQLPGRMLGGGATVLTPTVKIDNRGSTATTPGTGGAETIYPGGGDGEAGRATPAASFFYAQPTPHRNLWVGIAVTAPFGLALDYGREWFGRYDSVKSSLLTSNIAPSVAYKVNELVSVGAGVDVQYAYAKITNAVPDTLAPGGPSRATDGFAELKGHSWAVGFNAGVLITPAKNTKIGVHYRSGMRHRLDGSVTVRDLQGGLSAANGRFDADTEFRLPAIASLALAQKLGDWTLYGEAQWFEWRVYDEVRVRFDNGSPTVVRPQHFRNSRSLALGAEYRLADNWTVRGGVRVEDTPTVDAFRNTSVPDSDLRWVGAGFSYRPSPTLVFDFGLLHAMFKDAPINAPVTFFPGSAAAGTVTVRGQTHDSSVTTVAASAHWRF